MRHRDDFFKREKTRGAFKAVRRAEYAVNKVRIFGKRSYIEKCRFNFRQVCSRFRFKIGEKQIRIYFNLFPTP